MVGWGELHPIKCKAQREDLYKAKSGGHGIKYSLVQVQAMWWWCLARSGHPVIHSIHHSSVKNITQELVKTIKVLFFHSKLISR